MTAGRSSGDVEPRTVASGPAGSGSADSGSLSLEMALLLPVVALVVVGLLQVAALGRDLLVLQEAARVGARVAATTTGTAAPERAARAAAPELRALTVTVTPAARADGDIVLVEVTAEHRLGPTTRVLSARALARVEPVVLR